MAETNTVRAEPWLTADRLGAFTDGVIAIIITILVLKIEVPHDHDFAREGTLSFLIKIEHHVLIYLLSFFLILTYWLLHYVLFHYVVRTDRVLLFCNGVFLFLLSLSPFTMEIAGTYEGVPTMEALFGLNYCLSGMVFFAMWRYAATKGNLLRQPMDSSVRRTIDRHILVAPLLSLAGMIVAAFSFRVAAFVYLAIPLFYLRKEIIDARWRGGWRRVDGRCRNWLIKGGDERARHPAPSPLI